MIDVWNLANVLARRASEHDVFVAVPGNDRSRNSTYGRACCAFQPGFLWSRWLLDLVKPQKSRNVSQGALGVTRWWYSTDHAITSCFRSSVRHLQSFRCNSSPLCPALRRYFSFFLSSHQSHSRWVYSWSLRICSRLAPVMSGPDAALYPDSQFMGLLETLENGLSTVMWLDRVIFKYKPELWWMETTK